MPLDHSLWSFCYANPVAEVHLAAGEASRVAAAE
jgi:hypothetical protein